MELADIKSLAEGVYRKNSFSEKVNLEKIARRNRIAIINGNYGGAFWGMIRFCHNKFYIHINDDLISSTENGRLRFTLAHEFGHFYIPHHRALLEQGKSLLKESVGNSKHKQLESEANLFASSLLMPNSVFTKQIIKYEAGFRAILAAKAIFESSIESTAIQYLNCNICPSLMIKWNPDNTVRYSKPSQSLTDLTSIKYGCLIKADTNFLKNQANILDGSKLDFTENAVQLSKWVYEVQPNSSADLIGLEQTLIQGDYGAITLLTFIQ